VAARIQTALQLWPTTRRRPTTLIRAIKLYHRQIYGYAYHRPQFESVRTGSLDDKRIGDTRFAAVAEFLENIPTTCPHELFVRDDNPKARASQAHPDFANVSRIIVNRKENAATQITALIIPAVGNNKLRHETLQRFMLANDSVSVAIEIPIWLTEDDSTAVELQHGIELAPRVGVAERTITGHIDFLQVRNGAVHIFDYKPDARTNKPIILAAEQGVWARCRNAFQKIGDAGKARIARTFVVQHSGPNEIQLRPMVRVCVHLAMIKLD
jgi:hypothetical protein